MIAMMQQKRLCRQHSRSTNRNDLQHVQLMPVGSLLLVRAHVMAVLSSNGFVDSSAGLQEMICSLSSPCSVFMP